MYLHLGNEVIVRRQDIVGIFDLENTSISKFTKEFLAQSEANKQVVNVTYELPKSFVVCCDAQGNQTVYISQISPVTLKKRYYELKL